MPGSFLSDQPLPCPDREALQAFALGRLSEAEIDSIAEHLDTCPDCASLLDALHASPGTDSVQERVRRCLLSPPSREIEAWDAIEAQLTVPDRPGAASPTDFRIDQNLGSTLGGYQLLERLGKGGMGVVYRAVQLALGRQVALKTLHHQALDAPALCARFRTEGAALARLDHPGIVRVLDLAEHRGVPFLVMELVEGQTLSQRLRAGWLAFRQAAGLVRDLAVAVAYAHSRGVLHRDLKPSNVLLDAAGTPRVADFGLAKLLDRDDGLTASDMVLGTPAYMSPEQAGGQTSRIGPAADVWALGVILYECLTGRPPFQGDSKPATLDLVRTAPLLPPSRRRRSIPAGLEAICLTCLDKDPARRYPGAAALADDLGRWLAGQRPLARPRRLSHRAAVAALAVLVLSVAAGWLALSGMAGPRPAAQPADEEPEVPLREGTPQVLLGATGRPTQLRQLTGKPIRADAPLADDGSFAVEAASQCLLELLADPGHDRYRLSAQVRHLASDRTGAVGLYVGRHAHPRQPTELHELVRASFNDVLLPEQFPLLVRKPSEMPTLSAATLELHLHSSDHAPPYINSLSSLGPGIYFRPAGANTGPWHDLELTVTPGSITVRFDANSQRISAAVIRERAAGMLRSIRTRIPDNRTFQQLNPRLPPRGGIGIYTASSKATFRNIRLTPLSESN